MKAWATRIEDRILIAFSVSTEQLAELTQEEAEIKAGEMLGHYFKKHTKEGADYELE